MPEEKDPKDVEKQDTDAGSEQTTDKKEDVDVVAERTKLEADYNKVLGQKEILEKQVAQTQFQPAPSVPVPTASPATEPQVAPYPDTALAETDPAEYGKQARAYLDTTITSKVNETVGTITQQQEALTKYAKVSKYVDDKYGVELKKGLNSPLVMEATKIFQEKGVTAPQNSLIYAEAMQNSLDQARKQELEVALTAAGKATTDETARSAAAAGSIPDVSSSAKSGGDTSLPELDSEEVRINQAWGISSEKLQEAKARLASKEL